jgi:hypothetical protein
MAAVGDENANRAPATSSTRKEQRMQKRRRLGNSKPLEERLADEARRLRDEARLLPPGHQREELLGQAREDEWTSRLTGWLNSPGLQPPK